MYKYNQISTAQEEAYNKFSLAVAKFKADFDGVRSNVKANVSVYQGDSQSKDEERKFTSTVILYRSKDNEYVKFNETVDGFYTEDKETDLSYESNGKVWRYRVYNGSSSRSELNNVTSSEIVMDRVFADDLRIGVNIRKEEIISVEILDNGNYVIYVSSNHKEEENTETQTPGMEGTVIMAYEITPDCKFVKVSQKGILIDYKNNEPVGTRCQTVVTTFEYGVVEESYINSLIARANRATVSSSSIVGE